jgi:hypothetical protein
MAGDQHWYSKVLGLHCDGTNGSTTFTDVKGHTVTANGNVQISTAQYPALTGKTSSAYFDGNEDWLSLADSSDWAFGSGAFTLRARVRMDAYPSNNGGQYQMCIMSQDGSGTGERAFAFSLIGTSSSFTDVSFIGFDTDSTYTLITASYSFVLNTWYDVEATRSGNFIYLFVNGTLLNAGGTAFTRNLQNSSSTLKVGSINFDATYRYPFRGYMSEVEIYKGASLHTASFTPSSSPSPDEYVYVGGTTKNSSGTPASRLVRVYRQDTGALVGEQLSNGTTGVYKITAANTGSTVTRHFAICHASENAKAHFQVLGLHCDGTNGSTTFTDVKGHTVTANGNAQISTAQYPSLTGKTSSGYLDGSVDCLSLADSSDFEFGSADFAMRCKIRISSWSSGYAGDYYVAIFAKDSSTGRSYSLQLVGTSSSYTTLRFTGFSDNSNSTTIDGSYSFSLNTWYDIEVDRSGNLIYLFVNGSLLNTGGTAFSRNIQDTSNSLKIGAHEYDGTYLGYFNGYISEIEIYKGVAIHADSFTPSSTPFIYPMELGTENALIYDDITPA